MDRMAEDFRKATSHIPYTAKAVFPSEMFLFYTAAVKHRCDHIIESGVGYGGSTAYLATLFPDARITSVDDGKYAALQDLQTLFAATNVEIVRANSIKALPKIVQKSEGKSIAVLIDGPKREKAVALAQELLQQDSRVKFVAVHDLPTDLEMRGQAWTRNRPYQKHYGYLDEKVGEFREFYPMGPGLTLFYNA